MQRILKLGPAVALPPPPLFDPPPAPPALPARVPAGDVADTSFEVLCEEGVPVRRRVPLHVSRMWGQARWGWGDGFVGGVEEVKAGLG